MKQKVKDLIDALQDNYLKLSSGGGKKTLAIQRFNEFLFNLEGRFNSILELEHELSLVSQDKAKRPLSEIQLDIVDRVEAFHQQLYSSISAFIMVLNHLAPVSLRQGMPIRKVSKFLNFLKHKYPSLEEKILWLEVSRNFRTRFIDHVQQHTLHNWMTYVYPGEFGPECVIIYFIPKGSEVYYRGKFDPFAPDFEPPVNYESFYVSPPHKECFFALQDSIKVVINNLGGFEK